MSAEGKKKRGISGAANAKSIPFRYGGSKCDFSTHIGSSSHHSGRTLVTGMVGGDLAAHLGFKAHVSQRLVDLTEKALTRCTAEVERDPMRRAA